MKGDKWRLLKDLPGVKAGAVAVADNWGCVTFGDWTFHQDERARHPDFFARVTPDKPKVERCEVGDFGGRLLFERNGIKRCLSTAPDMSDFAGYEYEGGKVWSSPVAWMRHAAGDLWHGPHCDEMSLVRPVAVLFGGG